MYKKLSIKKSLYLNSALISLSFLILLIFFLALYSKLTNTYINENLLHHKEQEFSYLAEEITHIKNNLYILKATTKIFETPSSKEKALSKFKEIASSIIQNQKYQYNCYFAFEPKLSKKYFNKKAFILTTHKDFKLHGKKNYFDPNTFIHEEWFEDVYQKEKNEIWYHVAKESKDIVFSNIYFDQTYMKTWLITAALGIYKDNEFQGMVGIDIILEPLLSKIENFKIGKTGGLLLINKNDNSILTKLIGTKSFFTNAPERFKYKLEAILQINKLKSIPITENKLIELKGINNNNFFVSSSAFSNIPWILIAFQKKNEIRGLVLARICPLIVISLILLTLLVFSLRNFNNSLLSPLKNILSGINAVGKGNFNTTVQINTKNEFAQMANTFNSMSQSLRETTISKDFFDNVIKSISEILIVLNSNKNIQIVNQVTCNTLNFSQSDLIDKNFQLLIDETIVSFPVNKEMNLIDKNKNKIPVLFSASEILDTQRNVQGYVCVARDIRDRKKAEKEKETISKRLVDVSRQAGMAEVANAVLHNVGNILNSVNITVSNIEDIIRNSKVYNVQKSIQILDKNKDNIEAFLKSDPKGKKILSYVIQASKTLEDDYSNLKSDIISLVKHTRNISDIIAMQQNYSKNSGIIEKISIAEIIEDVIHMTAIAVNRHNIKIEKDIQDIPASLVDRHKTLQILTNLINNAKSALSENSEKIISLNVSKENNKINISIADNGIGIAKENLNKIFTYGYTTKDTGHGYGLHSSANYAKEMGGSLKVDSPGLGKGAIFTLSIPFKK